MTVQAGKKTMRFLLIFLAVSSFFLPAAAGNSRSTQIRSGWKNISAPLLMGYVRELCSEKYGGRLSGTKGYDDAAAWLAGLLAEWQLSPGGDDGTYFQDFPNPYTLVLPGAELILRALDQTAAAQDKIYRLEKDFFPGANDNASGVAVAMAVAQALAAAEPRPGCNVAFIFFAAEEQGVRGSEFYLQHQPQTLATARAFINLDGVGRGSRLEALAARNFPGLWKYFAAANRELVHASVGPAFFHNRARPRLDAALFMRAGIPTVSFAAYGAPEPPFPVYHTSQDRPEILTPEIMVDLGRLIFSAVSDLAAGKRSANRWR